MSAGLIHNLRNDAVDETVPLSRLLRRAKILSSLLRNDSFKSWVHNELDGYDSETEVPKYRMAVSPAQGTFVSRFSMVRNVVVLPRYNLPEVVKSITYDYNFVQSVGEIEALIESIGVSDEDNFQVPWPAEAVLLARDAIRMDDGAQLVEAYQLVTPAMLARVLDSVRNRLLDFVLELEELDPEIAESERKIPSLPSGEVAQALNVTIYGDNNVVASGKGISQSVSIQTGEVLPILDQIVEALRKDKSLSEESLKDSLDDVEILRREVNRENPRNAILGSILSHLGSIASVAGYVQQLQQLV